MKEIRAKIILYFTYTSQPLYKKQNLSELKVIVPKRESAIVHQVSFCSNKTKISGVCHPQKAWEPTEFEWGPRIMVKLNLRELRNSKEPGLLTFIGQTILFGYRYMVKSEK